jgi:ribose 5-phosphate isomerase B
MGSEKASQTVALTCDHGGFELRDLLEKELAAKDCPLLDLGINFGEPVDYPDYGRALAEVMASGREAEGVGICGSGISIALNLRPGVRAALCHYGLDARLSRQHNDANVLALGARATGIDVAEDCLATFLATSFEGGRQERRVEKLG